MVAGSDQLSNQWCIDNGGGPGTLEEIGAPCGAVVTATGSGNTISPSSLTTDSSGHGSFTIKSSVAEAKTVTVSSSGTDCGGGFNPQSVNMTFTAVAKAPTSTPVKTDTNSTSTTPTTAPQAPSAPTVSSIKVSGTKEDASKPISVASNKPLVLSGKTVPNGIVTLTIHSAPKTVATTADKNGDWTYTVTGLSPGSHYVEASVKDPVTNQTSPVAKLLSFTVTAAKTASTAAAPTATPAKKSSLGSIVVIIIILAVLAGGGWYGWQWRQKKKPAPISL